MRDAALLEKVLALSLAGSSADLSRDLKLIQCVS